MRPSLPVLRALVLTAAVLVGLQACGRRGPPERPDVAAPPAPGTTTAPAAPAQKVSPEGHIIPNRPFVLDPLL